MKMFIKYIKQHTTDMSHYVLNASDTKIGVYFALFCRLRIADFHGLPAENLAKAAFNWKNNSLHLCYIRIIFDLN